jgi:hypothetical protein
MDVLDSLVEVNLPNEENFLKVKETLTRIGIAQARTLFYRPLQRAFYVRRQDE